MEYHDNMIQVFVVEQLNFDREESMQFFQTK
jgi:hypothetical protein